MQTFCDDISPLNFAGFGIQEIELLLPQFRDLLPEIIIDFSKPDEVDNCHSQ